MHILCSTFAINNAFSGYSGYSGRSDRTIGKVPVWGPGFKVSFDFYLNSLSSGIWRSVTYGERYINYTSIFTMRSAGASEYAKSGEGVPAVFIGNTSLLCVTFPLNGDTHKGTCGQKKVEIKTWYTLVVSSIMEGPQVNIYIGLYIKR